MKWLFILFCLMACVAARAGVDAIPESEQAALALKIIDAYDGPRPARPPQKLRVFYYTPADRVPAPQYQGRLDIIMADIQKFYRDGMARLGFGPETFPLERDTNGKLILHFVQGKKLDADFPVWKGMRGTGDPGSAEKVINECNATRKAAGIAADNETFLYFCNLADWDAKAKTFKHHSPYFGTTREHNGICFAADSEILDLKFITNKEPTLDDQEFGPMSLGKFETIFIGGIAHELGHAFFLPHCGARKDEKPLGVSIMGAGNHYYHDELRGEDPGAFLTMASAMRLAGNPLFRWSARGWGKKASLQQHDLTLSTNVTRADLIGRPGTFRIEGTIQGTPPVYGVVAYFNPKIDAASAYFTPTATSVPDARGQFAIEVSDVPSTTNGELRIEFCHANGAVSERYHDFQVTPSGTNGQVDKH